MHKTLMYPDTLLQVKMHKTLRYHRELSNRVALKDTRIPTCKTRSSYPTWKNRYCNTKSTITCKEIPFAAEENLYTLNSRISTVAKCKKTCFHRLLKKKLNGDKEVTCPNSSNTWLLTNIKGDLQTWVVVTG